ncbi:YqzE family protein [Natribacillus halophilus]|uniref:YqzE-like protein n=1 Tax=Natribacillus halophilus TaxID=549003 RepID=A0A1G8JMA0_9BACI|nr:YqzE family protein [Natribacillus halophilus]SDI32292.1 YqzE-like protein [Natribacillus halophilus]
MNPNPYFKYLIESFLRRLDHFAAPKELTRKERRRLKKKRKSRLFTVFGMIPTALKISMRRSR